MRIYSPDRIFTFATVALAVLTVFTFTDYVYADSHDRTQSSKVRSNEIGPMQYEVTCFEAAEYCAEEFKRLCPNGHKVGGYFRNEFDHGQITAVITCSDNNI